ncbi:hypothetical protein N825_25340 [Skermanella stibiiresistens SB22]|uniref:Uncharacterized protein n=1 Tax=Skermanella stibiiresistens SB22 TaxID=1385369 RepID=W9GVV2_9PROT|nr:hypothetical protein N825_25340 [Skermanella stibiiresistens SB22]
MALRFWPLVERIAAVALKAGGEAARDAVGALALALGEDAERGGHERGAGLGSVPIRMQSEALPVGYAAHRAEALLGNPGRGDGWPVNGLFSSGKIGAEELRAATLIRAAAEIGTGAGRISAMDYGKVRVDGGKLWSGHLSGLADGADMSALTRWIQAMDARAGLREVKGSHMTVSALDLVTHVVVLSDSTRALDRRVGLRNGKTADMVAVALKLFVSRNWKKEDPHPKDP